VTLDRPHHCLAHHRLTPGQLPLWQSEDDPDTRTLICRVCGELFIGREGWLPICKYCWQLEVERLRGRS
jgi:hypothetical protein